MKDITYYVHIPFCNSKCHFCTYVAHISTKDLVRRQTDYTDYLQALKAQIRYYSSRLVARGYKLSSAYFGGGTPTTFSTAELCDLLATIKDNIDLSPAFSDVTLETTPENVFHHDLDELRRCGFDRISMGVQSMNDERLKRIGRCHTAEQVRAAVAALKKGGYGNINVDLLVGLPQESAEELDDSLEKALALEANHLTTYLYVPVAKTVLNRRLNTDERNAEGLAQKYTGVQDYLEKSGYKEYMYQYFSNDNTKCICDWVYFGLHNEWIGFGSDANSLLNQKVLIGPPGYRQFIADCLKPARVVKAYQYAAFLETHFYWQLISESGLDFERFERLLGIPLEKALHVSRGIQAWYNYLMSEEALEANEQRLCFRSSEARTHYACKRMGIHYSDNENVRQRFYEAYGDSKSRGAFRRPVQSAVDFVRQVA